jgi:hypothetical protein
VNHEHLTAAGLRPQAAALWTVDLRNLRFSWSEHARLLFEAPPNHVPVLLDLIDLLAPESRSRLVSAALECITSNRDFCVDVTIRSMRGSRKRLLIQGGRDNRFASGDGICGTFEVLGPPFGLG